MLKSAYNAANGIKCRFRHYIIMPNYLNYVEWQYIHLVSTQDVYNAFSSFGDVIRVTFHHFRVN